MRLPRVSSVDGYFARSPEDDMAWTGPFDKAVFRLLALSNADDMLLAGSRIFDQRMERLSRDPNSLDLVEAAPR